MSCPNPPILTFDYAGFIIQIPAYSNSIQYPEATLQVFWNAAINYISDIGNFGALQGQQRQFAINLMLAHLVYISDLVAAGQVPAILNSASIDKINVGITPLPMPNQWQGWLNISPYGQQLLALLQGVSVGGFFVAGPYGGIQGYNPSYGYGYGGSL